VQLESLSFGLWSWNSGETGMATCRSIEASMGTLCITATLILKIQLLPIDYGLRNTQTCSHLFPLLPSARLPKLQSSELYPKYRAIIWKIHKYSLGCLVPGWMASPTYANLDPTATSFAAANTTTLVAAKRHHRWLHSNGKATLFATLMVTIIWICHFNQ
jgi:hypothetical protein